VLVAFGVSDIWLTIILYSSIVIYICCMQEVRDQIVGILEGYQEVVNNRARIPIELD